MGKEKAKFYADFILVEKQQKHLLLNSYAQKSDEKLSF